MEGPAIATNGPWITRLDFSFPQISARDFDVAVVGKQQLRSLAKGVTPTRHCV
jgi:hypothetical protein